MSEYINEKVYPGYSPNAKNVIDTFFNKEEKAICSFFSREFYITHAGTMSSDGSDYCYFLIKPTATFEEATNIYKEVVVILSKYPSLEARTLEIYDQIVQTIKQHRYENFVIF